MSWSRHPVYAWGSGFCECEDFNCNEPSHELIHLWVRKVDDEGIGVIDPSHYDDFEGGVFFPLSLFDELVVCRFAELVKEGFLPATLERLRDPQSMCHGNFGSWDALEALGEDPEGEFKRLVEAAVAARDAS